MSLFKKLVIIQGFFEIIGMVEFLSNQFLWGLMSDCDNRLLVPAYMMDGEVIPHGKSSVDGLVEEPKLQLLIQ